MNMSRGFFRLWVVISLIWIGILLPFYWSMLFPQMKVVRFSEHNSPAPDGTPLPNFFLRSQNGEICVLAFRQSDDVKIGQWLHLKDIRESVRNLPKGTCLEFDTRLNMKERLNVLLLIMSLPIFLIMFGSLVSWIWRGFRSGT